MTQPAPRRAEAWFVQAAGKVWGPYADDRIAAFIEEGRVAADTLLGASDAGPFQPAASQPRLRRLFGLAEPAPARAPVQAERPQPRPRSPQHPQQPQASAVPARRLLVWANLKDRSHDRFEAVVAAYGPLARVGPGLWLVRARMTPAGLRNVLTRRLQAGDSLMVVEARLDEAAWFNIDGDSDRTLRELWSAEK